MSSSLVSEELVTAALTEVLDPELGINIVDLGLVYNIEITDGNHVAIVMTLTTPGCPLHAGFAQEIERVLWRSIPELEDVDINLVWDPPWNPMMISPRARSMLGLN